MRIVRLLVTVCVRHRKATLSSPSICATKSRASFQPVSVAALEEPLITADAVSAGHQAYLKHYSLPKPQIVHDLHPLA